MNNSTSLQNKCAQDTGFMQIPVDYIKKHFKQNIRVEELATLVHLSVSAFQRKFKKVIKKTPCQLILEVRMAHAKLLLVESNLKIADVGFESGFADHSYFSHQFKTYFNMLPSQYRGKYQAILI